MTATMTVSMKECIKCNKEIPEDALFCPYCGLKQSTHKKNKEIEELKEKQKEEAIRILKAWNVDNIIIKGLKKQEKILYQSTRFKISPINEEIKNYVEKYEMETNNYVYHIYANKGTKKEGMIYFLLFIPCDTSRWDIDYKYATTKDCLDLVMVNGSAFSINDMAYVTDLYFFEVKKNKGLSY